METLCKLIYEEYKTKDGYGKVLKRCVPFDGVYLYEIKATYARRVPPTTYYYLGRTQKEAKERFNIIMGSWMKIASIRLIPPSVESELILTNKLKMPTR